MCAQLLPSSSQAASVLCSANAAVCFQLAGVDGGSCMKWVRGQEAGLQIAVGAGMGAAAAAESRPFAAAASQGAGAAPAAVLLPLPRARARFQMPCKRTSRRWGQQNHDEPWPQEPPATGGFGPSKRRGPNLKQVLNRSSSDFVANSLRRTEHREDQQHCRCLPQAAGCCSCAAAVFRPTQGPCGVYYARPSSGRP